MADIVRGSPSREAGTQRQEGPRALEGLHLGFLVDAQHQRTVGGMEVQADDIAHLLDKLGVSRQLEGFDAMHLEAERLPKSARSSPSDRPTAAPKVRVLHCVISAAGASNVRVITATTRSSLTVRGAPGRGSARATVLPS